MAEEYTLTLPAEPLASNFAGVLARFENRVKLILYVVERRESSCRYAFTSPLRSTWPEDFVVSADSSEWYVAFYSATPDQKTCVLAALTVCLHEVGATASFEEP